MTDILWQVAFAAGAGVLVAWFVLTHVFFQPIARFVASTFMGRGSSTALSEAVAKKAIYGVAVVFLFTYAYVWRSVVVDPAGKESAVREQEIGDVHLDGLLKRLSLGGFRGVTTCYLWSVAMDQQKKNQLSDLEVTVGLLTDLQPHFNTPWLFQAWNFAYNVSNKTDQTSDKYYWISRGVQLLANGERQNKDNPDLRFELAATYQHKICQSDETNYHRSLYQLSLIPPDERDPARFRVSGDKTGRKINYDEFIPFCENHPQLIRRLREGIHKDTLYEQRRLFSCATPEEVIRFLKDNYRVPSLYKEDPDHPGKFVLDEPLARFPVLPPTRSYPKDSPLHLFLPEDDLKPTDLITEDSVKGNLDPWDAFLAAGAWYGYSQEPLPAPSPLPGDSEPIVDRIHQRANQHMLTIIFRHYPARAQSYMAERLEEEGWFDDIGWSTKGPEWFSEVIGDKQNWAVSAWGEAYKQWRAHGVRNHLLFEKAEDEQNKRDLAAKYRKDRKLVANAMIPPVEDDPKLKEGWEAARFMFLYDAQREVSAFSRNYNRPLVEQYPETVRARELFYKAQGLALIGSTTLALRTYQNPDPGAHPEDPNQPPVLKGMSALDAWAKILREHDDFRRDDLTAEESYETELDYLDVLNRALPGNEMKAQLGAAAQAGAGGWLNVVGLAEVGRPTLFPPMALTQGPFDQVEKDGTPWIQDRVKKSVLERRRLYQPRKKDTIEAGAVPQPIKAPSPEPVKP